MSAFTVHPLVYEAQDPNGNLYIAILTDHERCWIPLTDAELVYEKLKEILGK